MGKLKFRNVKELCGGCNDEVCSQRHGSFRTERGHCERYLGLRTCTVCATPCSCCKNFDQEAFPMGIKADVFLDSSKAKDVSQRSDNDAHKLASSLGSLCNDRHHTHRETSNLLSGCSSHDSSSENAESKVNLRALDSSEDTSQKVAEDHSFVKSSIFLGEQNFSNRCGQQKEYECFGDNISCIGGSDNKNVNTERKNTPSRLASVNSFSTMETPNDDQPVSCRVSSSPFCEVENSRPRRRDKFTNESSQTVAVCSNKSDLSENSSLKRESSECYEEQVESSLTRVATARFGGQINEANSNAECVKPDTEKTDGIVAGVIVKCPIQKEDFRKVCGMADDESDFVKPCMDSQPVDDRLNAVELEVKVCDICGDTGREDLLANCSKCSDGAEHIYCMRVKLDKIPKGDWLCEDCFLNEDTKKHMQDKFEGKNAMVASQPSLKKTMQNSGNLSALDQSNSLILVKKNSGIEESRTCKVESSPSFISKRPANSLEAISVTKRRVLESINPSGFFSSSCKMSLNSSFNKEKMKQTHEVTPPGSLSRSKSFNTVHWKEKVQLAEKGILKQNFARENSIINNKEVRVARMMKSKSFNNASSGHTDASDSKVALSHSSSSHVTDLRMLRHAKEKSSTETECSSKLHKPFICSPLPDSGTTASVTDLKIAYCGETMPPHIDGDLVDVQQVKSNNLSNSSSPLNKKPNEEQNRVFNDVGQHILHSSDNAKTINRNDSNTTLHSKKGPLLKDFSSFASAAAQPSWISVVPQLSYIWKGQFEIQGDGRFLSACDGIQAHLSTCASPKVFEVVQKLPQKILLEEVPLSNRWPTQFLENATEDKIALYFFASDIESYDRSYKGLLDCMIKNDLSLKGNFDGVELLIFASNLLPEKSQRWNKMLFLWGVFRGRWSNCSLELQNLNETICGCSRNEVYPNRNQDMSDFPMSGSHNLCSCAHSSESLSASSTSYNVQQKSKSSTLLDQLACKKMAEDCGPKTFSVERKSVNFQTGPDCQQSCPYNAKTEYMSTHVSQTKSSERQEKGSERGQIVDHSFKQDSEHNVHSMRIDDERKCKKLKSCLSDVREYNTSKNTVYLSDTCPIGMNGLGPSFDGKRHIGSEAHDTSFSRMEFKSSQPHVRIKDGSEHLESEFLNLELSLRIDKGSTKQIAMPPFYGETIQDKYSKPVTTDEKGDSKPSVSLSLSLALPSFGIDQVAKPCSETKLLLPEWHGVNTSLSL